MEQDENTCKIKFARMEGKGYKMYCNLFVGRG